MVRTEYLKFGLGQLLSDQRPNLRLCPFYSAHVRFVSHVSKHYHVTITNSINTLRLCLHPLEHTRVVEERG